MSLTKSKSHDLLMVMDNEYTPAPAPAPALAEAHAHWHAVHGALADCPLDCGAADLEAEEWGNVTCGCCKLTKTTVDHVRHCYANKYTRQEVA